MNSHLLLRYCRTPCRLLLRSQSSSGGDTGKTTATAESIIASAVDAEKKLVQDMFEEEDAASRQRSEEDLLALRDKSRLRPYHRRHLHPIPPTPTEWDDNPACWWHHTVKHKRRLYAKFGEASGFNPGMQWPTKVELERRLEYEAVAHPFTLREMMDSVQEKRRLEKEAWDQRTKELDENMAKLEQSIQEVLDKRAAKERDLQKAAERKEKLVEEVRRHFGYTVDPKDERFKALLERKEKEEKKKMKDAKKLERQQKLLERLAEQAKAGVGGTADQGPKE